MFAFVKNNANDLDLRTISGSLAVPVSWWWERVGESAGEYVWIGLSLLTAWVAYLVVSVGELVAWFFYMFENYWLAAFWFSTIGYWGSIFAYAFPWIFACV